MTRRVKTHIRLGIRSVSPSDQSPRCPHEKKLRALPTHREISRSFSAKSRGVSPRNVVEFLRELLRSFSAKFRGVTFGEISIFFVSAKKNYFAQGVYRGETRKKNFFLG